MKKGFALLIVVAIILALSILVAAVGTLSTSHYGTSHRQIQRTRALYAAEAAMQHALWNLRTNGVTLGPLALPADFDVNGIEDSDITITVGNIGATVPGVHRIDIAVDY